MSSWILSLHWCCLCWPCYHVCSTPSKQHPPINAFAAPLDFKVTVTQNKTPKRGRRWPVVDNPHTSRLTRCPSHDWSSTARVAHQGHRFWEWKGSDPLKYVGRVWVYFDPLKCHSFIQNCCCITVIFTASRMNSWIPSLHWSCLCWRCYHPFVWSAPSRQCPPINAFAAMGL